MKADLTVTLIDILLASFACPLWGTVAVGTTKAVSTAPAIFTRQDVVLTFVYIISACFVFPARFAMA